MSELVIIRKEGLTLKSPELNKATDAIVARFESYRKETAGLIAKTNKATENAGRDIGKILAEVESKQAYKVDGFTSVPKYAEAVLGLPTSTASALLRYGTMLNDPDIPDAIKALPWSVYDAGKSAGKQALIEGVKNGEITENSTQKDMKAYAAKVNADKPKKAKVLPKWNVCDLYSGKTYSGILEQEVDDSIKTVYGDIEIVKLPAVEGEDAPAMRKLYITSKVAIIMHFFKYSEKSSKEASAKSDNMEKARSMAKHGLDAEAINDILGTSFSDADIANLLK